MLREFVNLIERLSFKSSKIIALKKHFYAKNARNLLENFKSLFVTNDVKVKKKTKMQTIERKEISKR